MSDNVPLQSGRLGQKEIDSYWENGLPFPIDVLQPEKAKSRRAEFEQLARKWLEADLPHPLNAYKRVNSQCVVPIAARLALDRGILDVVECIPGPDIMIRSAEFFVKEPGANHVFSMHQNLTCWGFGETSNQVTAWLALSPPTVESGCTNFAAGSHKNPILPHNDTYSKHNLLSRGREIEVDVADSDKTAIELKPGQMSLHHGLTIHGSGINHSDDRRIGFAIRYINPNAVQKRGSRDFAMLARGVDMKCGFMHYAPPTEPFSEQSLKLYNTIRTAQLKVLMKDVKQSTSMYQRYEDMPTETGES
ncbi:MAG: phytanoyl-CoA dioxygenase family protein [Roseovarius sp.]|nr:phytanoyl-CoA dioxygenase family protein [Roseovarius sp.]